MTTPEQRAFSDLDREEKWPADPDGTGMNDAPPVPLPPGALPLTDAHLQAALRRAMLWVGILGFACASLVLMIAGWRSATLLLVGAAISLSGLWEWQKLAVLISARLAGGEKTGTGRVVTGFLLRLLVAGAVLYVSLRSLHGSVFALLGGLALAVIALGFEAVRLIRSP